MKKNIFTLMFALLVFSVFAETNIYSPTLVAPSNGASNQVPNVLLNWDAVPGGIWYKVEVATDTNFTSPIIYTSTSSAINAIELSFGTQYYWRVKAFELTDSSAWSSRSTFSTINLVTVTSPLDSTWNHYVRFLMKWNSISGVSNYDWEIDSAATFDSPLYRTGSALGTATSAYTKQLNFGQFYYLRMRARHSLDTSSWSAPLAINTLSTFNLRSPNDSITSAVVTTKWDWTGSTYYDLAFAVDSILTSPVIITVDSSHATFKTTDTIVYGTSPVLFFDTKFYWSVRSRNAFDTSAWMPSKNITTIDLVTLTTPANGLTNVSTKPTFKWSLIKGISHYTLQYDTSSLFTNPVMDSVYADTVQYIITNQLLAHTKYYWRVKAVSSVDQTLWCAAFNFTTGGGIGVESQTFNRDNVNIYPNPCQGKLVVEIESSLQGSAILTLSNILGQKLITREINLKNGFNSTTLNLDDFSNGIYLLSIQSDKSTYTRKVNLDK
jgi:hypothetical protein